jgi:hypothetical protein
MFDIEQLTDPAKAEAMRVGNPVILDSNELIAFMNNVVPYLEDGEVFSIKPIGNLAGAIFMYAVRIIPVLKLRA